MAEEVEIVSAEDVKPGEIAKKMTFGGEEFEVLFAKGNPGKTREELEEIKRRVAEADRLGRDQRDARNGVAQIQEIGYLLLYFAQFERFHCVEVQNG